MRREQMSLFSLYFYALFIVVLGLSVLLFKLLPDNRVLQNAVLIAASMIFIAFASWKCVIVILIASLITWLCGMGKSKVWQYTGIAVLIVSLVFYKIADAKNLNIIIPLGVSFFTFNAISYLADVAKGETQSVNFFRILLYLSFFPRLTSGPLQKASEFFLQIENERKITKENLSAGIQIYLLGLFKKLVLADRLLLFVNEVYATPNAFSGASIWLAIISYSLLIYFDFSGYSDMAIGTGKMLGFDLPVNFNMPYLSQNVTEFWRRWHISLSTWIRNYIYIPLGGNRKGKIRQNLNLLIAMTLCGFWHGATVNFILWGFVQGVSLLVHKQFLRIKKTANIKAAENPILKFISIFLTFIFISLTLVLFRTENISEAFLIYRRIFTFAVGLNQLYFWSVIEIVVLLIVSVVLMIRNNGNAFYPCLNLSKYTHLTLFFVFIGLLFALCYTNGSPFIYGAF